MSRPVVTIEQGKVEGKVINDYHGGTFYSFLGIPYAKAPVGDLRFKAPEPPEPWTDTKNCTKEGCECPSNDMYFGYFVGEEDNCLNLNVYTKDILIDNKNVKKPVMVWIHGGAFLYGSNKPEIFGPDYLMTQDIVLVSINYRLGIFGFLCLKDKSLDVPGNAGLKDMVMALKWVNKNIDKFGGDPKNVTIFGESAGAASVNYLTLSPLSKGLFHKAIMQSGSALANWSWGTHNASYAATCLEYKETEEKDILRKLKQEKPKKLVKAQHKTRDVLLPSEIRPWGPVIEPPSEGAFLTQSPMEILKSGKQHQVPMIIGYNSKEGIFYGVLRGVNPQTPFPREPQMEVPYEFNLKADSEDSKEVARKIQKFYFNEEKVTEDNIDKTFLVVGDIVFVYPIQKMINYLVESSTQPVHVYRMSLESSLNFFKFFSLSKSIKSVLLFNFIIKITGNYMPSAKKKFQSIAMKKQGKYLEGVSHGDDLFYLFTLFFTPKIEIGSEEDKFIQRFVKLWTNFAKTGNPTPEKDEVLSNVTWPPSKKGRLQMLDIGNELKVIENVDKKRVDFWEGLYEHRVK